MFGVFQTRSSIENLLRRLLSNIQENMNIVLAVAKTILEDHDSSMVKELYDPSVREAVGSEMKRRAGRIDLSFWDQHARTFRDAGLRPRVFSTIEIFFERLKRFKERVLRLPQIPSEENIKFVLIHAQDVADAFGFIKPALMDRS
jgi:hypothetical protein